MDVPYLRTGRTSQKLRTRDALIAAARQLLAEGVIPTIEEAASEASVGRTTAYRYFPMVGRFSPLPSRRSRWTRCLEQTCPKTPLARLEVVAESLTRGIVEHEPEYRAQPARARRRTRGW